MRIGGLDPSKFDERQKQLYDRIAGRRGHVRGPYLAWLHQPELCDKVEGLNSYLRWDSSLPTRISELSILVTARFWDAAYPWAAHADKAVDAGVPQHLVDALARGDWPEFEAEDEAVFYRFAMELLRNHFVSQPTYDDASRIFGESGVVDLVGAIGAFSMLAMVLNTFEVDLHSGRPEPFPDVLGYRRNVADAR